MDRNGIHYTHPSVDKETKVAVLNKFLTDIENKDMPAEFDTNNATITISLNRYDVSLSDGKNQIKLNNENELEMFYQLENGFSGFKDEILSNEYLWTDGDIDFLYRAKVIDKDTWGEKFFNETPTFPRLNNQSEMELS